MKKILFFVLSAICVCISASEFPVVFCQAQLKYPLDNEKNSYFSNWNDWPLLVNSDFKPDKNGQMGKNSFLFSRKIARSYGLSGFAFWQSFIRNRKRSDFLAFAEQQPIDNFKLVPIISLSGLGKFEPEFDTERLLKSPQILEVKGKKLFWTYGIRDSKKLSLVIKEMKKYGDNFIVVYGQPFLPEIMEQRNLVASGKPLPQTVKELIKNNVRAKLREFDGFAWIAMSTNAVTSGGEKPFNAKLYKAVMETTAGVFKEPEFNGRKYFGAAAVAEHSNSGRLGHTLSSKGTLTLRQSLGIALDLGAQLINIPEWDEQNENTSLRPTAYNSFAYMRIIRYLTKLQRGEDKFHLPNDDLTIPNVILSYRKIAMYGEKLEIEILNIPDNVSNKENYQLCLKFKTIAGKEIYNSGMKTFKADKLMEHRPAIASEKLAGERLIIPELEIIKDGKTLLYNQGFAPIQLQPTWCRDYKYVKQPLRDMLPVPQKLEWSYDNKRKEVTAKICSQVPLRSVELLDCGDAVFSAGKSNILRENSDVYAFRVQLVSLFTQRISGIIKVSGTPANWVGRSKKKDNGLIFRNANVNHFFQNGGYFSVSKKANPANVYVELNFPKYISAQKWPLSTLLSNGTTVIDLGKGAAVAITRQLRQIKHASNLNSKQVEFTIPLAPDMRHSVLQLQLLGEDGKLWRSNPLLSAPVSGEPVGITVWSDSKNQPVEIAIPHSLLPEIEYEFSGKNGLAEVAAYGRPFWAMRGIYYNLGTLRLGSGGGCGYGVVQGLTLHHSYWEKTKIFPKVPELYTETDGSKSLRFTGIENLAIPPGFMPRRAGFTLEFKMFPEVMDKRQYILGCRRNYPGVLSNLWLLPNGDIKGKYTGYKRDKDFSVPAGIKIGQWNIIRISCNLKELVFTINGKIYPPVAIQAPGMYDMPLTIGCFDLGQGLKGRIADLRMVHSVIK